jgi:glycosyltransferase involved in cell wall biosynthesis
MHCPRLKDLPPPPQGKTGWPWTEESDTLTEMTMAGTPWPKISIVTPSYNQGDFIEETIRSVLLQGYPNIEYFIIDGGSTDKTIEIIKKYEPWITSWVSERDNGQSSAINKGWRRASGDICSYLNSDDTILKNTLSQIGNFFHKNSTIDMVYGNCYFINEKSQILRTFEGKSYKRSMIFNWELNIGQPSVFFRRKIFHTIGYLNEQYRYVMDFDFWIRTSISHTLEYIPCFLGTMRLHPEAKTIRDFSLFYKEELLSLKMVFSRPDLPREVKRYEKMSFASSYLRAGYREFQLGNLKEARHLLMTALKKYPPFILNPFHMTIIWMTAFPPNIVMKLYRIKTKLLKRKSFIELLLEIDT